MSSDEALTLIYREIILLQLRLYDKNSVFAKIILFKMKILGFLPQTITHLKKKFFDKLNF